MTTPIYEISKFHLDKITAAQGSCINCGGPLVAIRARQGETETRIVCPTCLAEACDVVKYSEAIRRVVDFQPYARAAPSQPPTITMPVDKDPSEAFTKWWNTHCDPHETGRTRQLAGHAFAAGVAAAAQSMLDGLNNVSRKLKQEMWG